MLERARQLQRAQHLLQVAAIALEGGAITLRALGAEELGGDCKMTVAQLGDFRAHALVLALGERHEAQQCIRDAAARGQYDGQTPCGRGFEYGRHFAEAVGVGDARPPELVHDPGIGLDHLNQRLMDAGQAVRLY